MSIKKYIAEADTTITDAYQAYSSKRGHYSNMGAADSLQVFSIAHKDLAPELSRILVRFPIQKILDDRMSGSIPESGSVKFYLNLYNVEHPETLPKNYEMVVKPITGSWEEGFGLDLENFLDLGQTQTEGYGVGWKYRSTTEVPYIWTNDGGDYVDGYNKYFHFENGTEDLKVDVTDIIEKQFTNELPRDGFGVMLADQYETSSSGISYYTKRFSSRSSQFYYSLPCISAVWESLINDDRGNFYYSSDSISDEENTQNIYFYNKINGNQTKNIPNDVIPTVKILDENDNILLDNIVSEKVSTGKYKASFSLTGTVDATLKDVWYNGNKTYYIGEVSVKVREFDDYVDSKEYVININNLKKSYSNTENAFLRVHTRYKEWTPNIYKKFTNEVETNKIPNLYYKIIRLVDNKTVLDYGISPIKFTKCSYDSKGNYFELDMNLLEPGYFYGIKFMVAEGDSRTEYKNIFKFKVE